MWRWRWQPDAQLARRRTLRFRPPAHYGVGTRQREVGMRARRFWAALGSLLLVSGLAAPSMAADSPPPQPQTDMAALGDSITVAYDATRLLAAQPEYSWSTGYSILRALPEPAVRHASKGTSGAQSGCVRQEDGGSAGSGGGLEARRGHGTRHDPDGSERCVHVDRRGMRSGRLPGGPYARPWAPSPPQCRPGRGRLHPEHQSVVEVERTSSTARLVWGLYKDLPVRGQTHIVLRYGGRAACRL